MHSVNSSSAPERDAPHLLRDDRESGLEKFARELDLAPPASMFSQPSLGMPSPSRPQKQDQNSSNKRNWLTPRSNLDDLNFEQPASESALQTEIGDSWGWLVEDVMSRQELAGEDPAQEGTENANETQNENGLSHSTQNDQEGERDANRFSPAANFQDDQSWIADMGEGARHWESVADGQDPGERMVAEDEVRNGPGEAAMQAEGAEARNPFAFDQRPDWIGSESRFVDPLRTGVNLDALNQQFRDRFNSRDTAGEWGSSFRSDPATPPAEQRPASSMGWNRAGLSMEVGEPLQPLGTDFGAPRSTPGDFRSQFSTLNQNGPQAPIQAYDPLSN